MVLVLCDSGCVGVGQGSPNSLQLLLSLLPFRLSLLPVRPAVLSLSRAIAILSDRNSVSALSMCIPSVLNSCSAVAVAI